MAKNSIPVIRLTGYRVTDIQYKHYLDKGDFDAVFDETKSPSIKMKPTISVDGATGQMRMTAHIVTKQLRQIGDITIVGFFKFRDDVNEDSDKYRYLSVNGGAMVYPYLRATVSMLTALDNPDTVLLPTLNFDDTYKRFVSEDNLQEDGQSDQHDTDE